MKAPKEVRPASGPKAGFEMQAATASIRERIAHLSPPQNLPMHPPCPPLGPPAYPSTKLHHSQPCVARVPWR
eukprot:2532268-Alexandrium_andersonii.AAC.1